MRSALTLLIALLLSGCLYTGTDDDDVATDDDDVAADDDDSVVDDDDSVTVDDDDIAPDDDDIAPDDDDVAPDDDDVAPDDDDVAPDDDDVAPVDGDGDGWPIDEDCDDGDPQVFPGAPDDACDGLDTDCAPDGDEVDDDGDGWMECEGDCDDADPQTFPGAPDTCSSVDNDCDGTLDPMDGDDDGDGATQCNGDCDDTDPTVGPSQVEICDGLDTDCDGLLPPGEVDADGDGWMECEGDCDDTDATVAPGQPELCDGLDTDCDGTLPTDEVDGDNDGVMVCDGDCDDGDPAVWPASGWDDPSDGLDTDCGAGSDTSLAWAHAFVEGGVGDGAGTSVAFADVDGDGLSDVLVGAPFSDAAGADAGVAWLFFGASLAVGGTFGPTDADLELRGVQAGDRTGTSLASAGDVDGDGLDDLVIGAPLATISGSDTGVAYVVFGATAVSAASPMPLSLADVVLQGNDDGDLAGHAVASAGDMDGDGLDEVVVGAPGADGDKGYAYLTWGSTLIGGGLVDLQDTDVVMNSDDEEQVGWALAPAGDIDGDGLGDLLVGAPAQTSSWNAPGRAYLVLAADLGFGEDEFELTDAHARMVCPNGWLDCGVAVTGGDFDGDGLADAAVSTTASSWLADGAVYLFTGQALAGGGVLQTGAAWMTVEGVASGDLAGWSLSSGDVDGDGVVDLAIGVPLHDGAAPDVGAVGLMYASGLSGGTVSMAGAFDDVFRDDLAGDESGRAVAIDGDLNGDGRHDVLIGAPAWSGGAGRAVLLLSP